MCVMCGGGDVGGDAVRQIAAETRSLSLSLFLSRTHTLSLARARARARARAHTHNHTRVRVHNIHTHAHVAHLTHTCIWNTGDAGGDVVREGVGRHQNPPRGAYASDFASGR